MKRILSVIVYPATGATNQTFKLIAATAPPSAQPDRSAR